MKTDGFWECTSYPHATIFMLLRCIVWKEEASRKQKHSNKVALVNSLKIKVEIFTFLVNISTFSISGIDGIRTRDLLRDRQTC